MHTVHVNQTVRWQRNVNRARDTSNTVQKFHFSERCPPVTRGAVLLTSFQVPTVAPGTVLFNTREIILYTGADYFNESSSLHICPLIPLIPFLILPFITLLTIIFLITFVPLLLSLFHTCPKIFPFIPSFPSWLFPPSSSSIWFYSSLSPSITVSSSPFILRIMFNL